MPSNALAEPTLNASFFTNILYIKFGSKEIFIYEERQNVSFVTFSACFIIVWATFQLLIFFVLPTWASNRVKRQNITEKI